MRVVIPSVGYAEMLQVNLPAWLALIPGEALRIVTDPADVATQRVARAFHVDAVVTSEWRADDAVFNKARALDDAFGFDGTLRPRPAFGEVCLALDADVFPVGKLPETIEPDVLYGCDRQLCPSPDVLAIYQQGGTVTGLQVRTRGTRGGGYFQLFRYRKGLTFGSFPDAGHYDLAFHQHFARVESVPGFHVLHLGRTSSKNWKGRVLPPWEAA